MSMFWTLWITGISVGLILACVWLIKWTQKPVEGEAKVGETTGHCYDGIEEFNNPLPRWWLWLFYITIVFSLVYFALYGGLGNIPNLLGWSQEQQWQDEMADAGKTYDPIFKKYAEQEILKLADNPDAMASGQRLFGTYCSVCHGSDARGSKGFPNLSDNDWLYGNAPEAVKASIMNGRQGMMPAGGLKGAAITDEEVDQLAEFVVSLSGREADASKKAAGQTLYMTYCAACHMPTGTGMEAMGAPNLTDNIWLYGGSLANIQESIRKGRAGKMPSHKDFLGNDKSHVLAAYVLSLSKKP